MHIQSKPRNQAQKQKLIKIIVSGVIATLLFALFPIIPQAEAGYPGHPIDLNFDGASSVYPTDIDGDGDIDVVGIARDADEVAWWENEDGLGGSWTKHLVDNTFDQAYTVYAADIDGDGDRDILGGRLGDLKSAWWENDGSGNFGSANIIPSAHPGADQIQAADIDGDGDIDVLEGGNGTYDDVEWYENVDGLGTAWTEHELMHLHDTRAVAEDVDNDGYLDILQVGAGTLDGVHWWENEGDKTFTRHIISDTFDGTPIDSGDFDDDGDMDILAGSNPITWWENPYPNMGDPWTKHEIQAFGGDCVQAKDVDGDGDIDVLGANNSSKVAWWENANGLGTSWTYHQVTGAQGTLRWVQATDIDGDGYTDIAGADMSYDDVGWWELEKEDLGAGGDDMYGVAVGDGNNDGGNEVYGANIDDHVYQFKWDGTTWVKTDLGPGVGYNMTDVAVGDGDNDTNNEVYGACADDHIYQFKWDGTSWNVTDIGFGTTAPQDSMLEVAVGDGNHDGTIEVYGAETNSSGDQGRIYQFRCTSGCDITANWTKEEVGFVGDWMFGVAVGDADNDGQNEVYGASGDGHIYRYFWNGISWVETDIGFGGSAMRGGVVVGDGNNDNENEVYGGNDDHYIYQFKCTANCDQSGNWQKTEVGSGGGYMYRLAVGDGDNDGQNEVYAGNHDGYVYQFKWNGTSWDKKDLLSGGGFMVDAAVGDGDNDIKNEIYGANEDHHIYAFDALLKHKINNLAGHLDAVLTDWKTINTETVGQVGAKYLSLMEGTIPISTFRLNFLADYNWSDVTADADVPGNKAVVYIPPGHTEVTTPLVLYVPKGTTEQVRLCVGAQDLSEVYNGCAAEPNVTSEYVFENGPGQDPTYVAGAVLDPLPQLAQAGDYWKITRITGTGAQGEGGEAPVVPEFTAITIIIAAVAGFAIYLLIRRMNQKRLSKKA